MKGMCICEETLQGRGNLQVQPSKNLALWPSLDKLAFQVCRGYNIAPETNCSN